MFILDKNKHIRFSKIFVLDKNICINREYVISYNRVQKS